ncbi:hypothetical protein GCM10008933_18260 [Paenibacillus motobuensis]|uniref:Uncharacterized protein n=1 Tax=Paenibacillus motobuensis TaxID=295324 RepID=A0ABN0Y979_9BACL
MDRPVAYILAAGRLAAVDIPVVVDTSVDDNPVADTLAVDNLVVDMTALGILAADCLAAGMSPAVVSVAAVPAADALALEKPAPNMPVALEVSHSLCKSGRSYLYYVRMKNNILLPNNHHHPLPILPFACSRS